jgi:hypothetical protein
MNSMVQKTVGTNDVNVMDIFELQWIFLDIFQNTFYMCTLVTVAVP